MELQLLEAWEQYNHQYRQSRAPKLIAKRKVELQPEGAWEQRNFRYRQTRVPKRRAGAKV